MTKIAIKPRLFLIVSVLVIVIYGLKLQDVTYCKIDSRFATDTPSRVAPDDFQANIEAKYGIEIKPISKSYFKISYLFDVYSIKRT